MRSASGTPRALVIWPPVRLASPGGGADAEKPREEENQSMAELSSEEIIQKIRERMAEKDEAIREQMMQLQQIEEQVKEKDTLIQELQERIGQLENEASEHGDLLKKLNEVLD
jgi:SMC interacting uncharacterized protein involved in chromosome segregation